MREEPLIVGRDEAWGWESPAPLEAGSTPTLTIIASGDQWAPALTAQHPDVELLGISDDGMTLTASAAPLAAARSAGEDGEAWLIAADGQALEVRVGRIIGATVYLSTPLPRPVVITDAARATLQWRRWSTTLIAEEEDMSAGPTAQAGHLGWRVVYSRLQPGGGAAPALDQGTVQIAARRFWTGLTLAELRRRVSVALYREQRAQSLQGLVDQALDELVAHIESRLPRDLDVTAIVNAADFVGPHAEYTRAILPKVDLDTALAASRKAERWADKLVDRFLQDRNGDGVPDLPPRSPRRVLGFAGGGFPPARRFTRDMDR